jgi:protein phosphatase
MANLKALLRQLFGGSSEQVGEPTEVLLETMPPLTAEEEPPALTDQVAAERRPCSGTFSVGWLTDVGRVRGHNEDALYVFTAEHEASNPVPPFGLFVLADGMGGHQSGEIASSLAVRVSASQLMSQVYLPILSGYDRGADQPSLTEVVREAMSQANRLVTQDLPGSGCTLTCGMILGDRLFIGHVGDSRAYLLRSGGALKQLTKDHSLVNRLIEMGQLTEEEAAVHPQRNVLYRAIGQGGSLEVDVYTYPLKSGDQLFLCSDGLWGMVEEAEIIREIEAADTPQAACEQLVAAANAAGGVDNITVILVSIWGGQD